MTPRKVISWLNLLMGALLLLVGVLHFMMLEHLTKFISSQLELNLEVEHYIVAIFKVNHIGSGVLVLLLGIMLIYLSSSGLSRGKKWGRNLAVLMGWGILLLSIILWLSVPRILLQAEAFKMALIFLSAVGVITVVPLLFFWKHFQEM